MPRKFVCIICPDGCETRAEIGKKENGAVEILSTEGATCKKNSAYVKQELKDPQHNITTPVPVRGGILPLASMRLIFPIPKCRIFDTMAGIRKCTLTAPVEAGTVVIHTLLGYDTNVIVTRGIPVPTEK